MRKVRALILFFSYRRPRKTEEKWARVRARERMREGGNGAERVGLDARMLDALVSRGFGLLFVVSRAVFARTICFRFRLGPQI